MGKYHITHDCDSLLDELFGAYDDFIKKLSIPPDRSHSIR